MSIVKRIRPFSSITACPHHRGYHWRIPDLVFASYLKRGRSQPVDATPSDVKVVFMRQGRRYGLSGSQRTDIWRRWKAGESLHEIGRALGKDHGSIQFLLSQHGGIAPAIHHRSQGTLTLAEREDISRGIASGSSIREIARGLQRAASTVSREVARNGGRPLYRASEADHKAWESALRPKVSRSAVQSTDSFRKAVALATC